MAGRTGEDEPCTALVGTLDKSDRELRPERGQSPAPCLTARGIPKAVRFEIVPGGVDKSQRALIVDIKIPCAAQTEQWRDPSIE